MVLRPRRSPKLSFLERVTAALEDVRPSLGLHGGDLTLIAAHEDTGLVEVRFEGACSGCGMAEVTLKLGIEKMLKKKVKGVKTVEEVF